MPASPAFGRDRAARVLAAGIGAFLAQTYALVPDGSEPAFLDLDAELFDHA